MSPVHRGSKSGPNSFETASLTCAHICRVGKRFQAVVISLKDAFFHHADALVGVAKDPNVAASTIYTFDLSRFEYQEA